MPPDAAAGLRLIWFVGAVVLADVVIGLPTLLWLSVALLLATRWLHRPSIMLHMFRSEEPNAPASVPERLGRRDAVALAGLGLVAIGIPLWMSAAAGGIGFPSNDDWVYVRGALSLFRTGAIDLPGHTAATVGQLALVQPLLWLTGGAMWVFTAFGLAMGLIAVVSTYLLARRFVGAGSAVFAVAVLLVYPGLARQMATFMTDLPACALSTLCLLLGSGGSREVADASR
jgi:hypothetical protein